jgi:O-antigen/teichoic acid export membrane protein
MKEIVKLISSLFTVVLTVWFVKWYTKEHFGKYALFFWINTIIALCLYFGTKINQPKEDTTPGYVYWERNVKNH